MATRERRYGDLPELASIAEGLAEIQANRMDTNAVSLDSPEATSDSGCRSEPDFSTSGNDRRGENQLRTSRRERTQSGLTLGTGYPRFVRDDDSLVKIGASSAAASTYEHRAPKAVVDAIVSRAVALSKAGSGDPFTAEALSDVGAHDDEQQVPSYQLYLCLAWLKRTRLIKQHGRKGYSLVSPDSFVSDVEEAWNNMEQDEA